MTSLLTHKDLSRLLGVSETTVKSYRRKFPGCVPVANEGKPIRFTPEAAKVCKRIRDLFELGMAVTEIRQRLSTEFDWIDTNAPQQKQVEKVSSTSEDGHNLAVFQPVATSVASLAKSMVGISQQQNSILKRLEGLEARLGSLPDEPCGVEGQNPRYAERLAHIEHDLSVVRTLLKELLSIVTAQERNQVEDTSARCAAENETLTPFDNNASYMENADSRDKEAQAREEEKFHLWSGLPLFARDKQNQYGNVAGRGRSCFSINDLKAVLTHRITSPDRFTLAWQKSGQEIWLLLELSGGAWAGCWRLLLTPARTIKGMDIIVAEHVFRDGNEVPAALLHDFVADILG